jgi:hypothetical protein
MSEEVTEFDRRLQQVYYHPNCNYFYYLLLLTGCLLIGTTIVGGYKMAESPTFIFVELLLNGGIAIDFGCRVRMIGMHKYLT